MKISIIGSGYVGLTSAICFASRGHEVICVDNDPSKIEKLQNKIPTIFENGLPEMLSKTIDDKKIEFTTNLEYAITHSTIVILAVGTPQSENGEADLSYILQASKASAKFLNNYKLFITKSTVPVGTNHQIKKIIEESSNVKIDIISNPEFMREGFAIQDFMEPDRIIIGAESLEALKLVKELYQPWIEKNYPILYTDIKTAELIKYASNAFLMTKVAFINEIENLSRKLGTNIKDIATGMGMDKRIGKAFLNPGPGIGGSCFPKDSLALNFIAKQQQIDLKILNQVMQSNYSRFNECADRIIEFCQKNQPNISEIAILGLAFKANTDDIRMSPAIEIIKILITKNFKISAYDPKAINNSKKLLNNKIYNEKIIFKDSLEECFNSANIIVITTEWEEFKKIKDFKNFNQKFILDFRGIL